MPNYKYVCTNEECNKEIDINCSMKDYSSTAICDLCDSIAERKVDDLLPQNYIVKCDGFYGKVSN
jgi:predicted nucleic acid-binding Zn ribbon protein